MNTQFNLSKKGLVLGIDGGGSKTACVLMNLEGHIVAKREGVSTDYRQHGINAVQTTIHQLRDECLADVGADISALRAVCIGIPNYGENAQMDDMLRTSISSIFPRFVLVNDVHVGWAGSLALKSGINLVSGTGSIAFGVDTNGKSARSGGWSERIGDEGSSYWLAIRGMQLFTKQSDYRVSRGPLYNIIKEKFALKDDFEFIAKVENDYLPYRNKVASFHYLVAEAARQGDDEVIRLYDEAAEELTGLVRSILSQLRFPEEGTIVSYSGGTFRVGDVLLNPLKRRLEAMGLQLQPQIYPPVVGALLLAVRDLEPSFLDNVLKGLAKERHEL